MKVLFVTSRYPTAQHPGDSPCIAQQKESLERLGHTIDVLYINALQSKLAYATAILKMIVKAQVLRQYDVIHAHYGWLTLLVARMQWRVPVVVTFRGSDALDPHEAPLGRFLARFANAVIVMTEQMRAALHTPAAHVVPYGVDTQLFKPCPAAEARQQLNLPNDAPLILFPYNPQRPEKRADLIHAAVDVLRREMPDVQLIELFGKPPETLAHFMNACDVLVLASDSEGSPSAIREALACRLPVVSVDVGDVRRRIEDVDGCFVAERSPEDIARQLGRVLKKRTRLNELPESQLVSMAYVANTVSQIYGEVAGSSQPSTQTQTSTAKTV